MGLSTPTKFRKHLSPAREGRVLAPGVAEAGAEGLVAAEHAEDWAVQRAALRPGVEYVVRLRARLSGVGATQPELMAEIDVVGPWN